MKLIHAAKVIHLYVLLLVNFSSLLYLLAVSFMISRTDPMILFRQLVEVELERVELRHEVRLQHAVDVLRPHHLRQRQFTPQRVHHAVRDRHPVRALMLIARRHAVLHPPRDDVMMQHQPVHDEVLYVLHRRRVLLPVLLVLLLLGCSPFFRHR